MIISTSTVPGNPCCKGIAEGGSGFSKNSTQTLPARASVATRPTVAERLPYCVDGKPSRRSRADIPGFDSTQRSFRREVSDRLELARWDDHRQLIAGPDNHSDSNIGGFAQPPGYWRADLVLFNFILEALDEGRAGCQLSLDLRELATETFQADLMLAVADVLIGFQAAHLKAY